MRKTLIALSSALLFAAAYVSYAAGPPPMAFPQQAPTVSQITGLFSGDGNYLKKDGTTETPGGTGDVVGPATNTDTKIPQWDGADSKTLKDGLGLDTDLSSVSASDDTVPSAKATDAAYIKKSMAASANCFLGNNGESTLGCYTQIQMSDDAAQFYSATASKGTRKLVQSSISDGILLTDTPVITGNVTWTNVSQAEGTYTRVFEEALNVFTVKQEFNATAGLQVGATGVLITSDDDGAITFLGTSAGYDEDLTLNLDDTENTAVVSSSTGLVKMSFTGISLDATVPIYSSTAATITVAGNAGIYFNGDDDAIAFNLPADPSGKTFCFRNLYAKAITVNPDDSDYIQLGAKKAAQGEAVVSTGAADELICLVGLDTSNWVSMGKAGTWAEESP